MISHLVTFLLGALTGAAGKYLADKYTDKRRLKEGESRSKKLFQELASRMPDLIKEMKDDLSKPDNHLIREFYILPHRRVSFMAGGRRYLYYFEEEHQDLLHKLHILEEPGFIQDITETNTPKFRMTEQFFGYVLKSKIKSGRVKI